LYLFVGDTIPSTVVVGGSAPPVNNIIATSGGGYPTDDYIAEESRMESV
jgi:hypothetical protein